MGLTDLLGRTVAFIHEVVLPVEDEFDGDIMAAGGDELRIHLHSAARSADVFAPHAPVDCGGLGLGMADRAPVFEAAGYSLFGPLAINANAPDEGNVHLLDKVATAAQRHRWLQPLAKGHARSAFAMTEPAPGAGADPARLTTRASRVDGGWLLDGRKWFITGADGAEFLIVVARTNGRPGDANGATLFLVSARSPGLEIVRHVGTTDRSMIGGHCELTLKRVFVPDDDVLGSVGEGFRTAQIRLAPARLTHVMRWIGAALRAHQVAVRHVAKREAFGGRLADLGMVQQMVADNEIDLAATRALLIASCAELDAGGTAAKSSSIVKTFGAEALWRVVDRSVQLCGGLGVSSELPVARIAREIRAFRIYDGPSEVHRWALSRRAVRDIVRSE